MNKAPKQVANESRKIQQDRLSYLMGDNLVKIVDIYLQYYFEKQNQYTDIDEFKLFLVLIITEYVDFVTGDHNGRPSKELTFKFIEIEEQYDKIIYHGRFNPVELRRQLEQQEKGLSGQSRMIK